VERVAAVPEVAGFFVAAVCCEVDFGAAAGVCASVANPSAKVAATMSTYFKDLESWTGVFEALFVIRFSLRFVVDRN
jgi:hypothetical protein